MPQQEQATRKVAPLARATSQAPEGEPADPLASGELADSLAPPIQRVEDPSPPPGGGGGSGRGHTGLPPVLRSGVEQLSGLSMDDVRVHRGSSRPAQLNAHAMAQGSDIHLAPGREADLPHEAWHVAQQKAGRVAPTTQLKGAHVNDSGHLESEADRMGQKALQVGGRGGGAPVVDAAAPSGVAQLRGENPHAKAVDHQGWTTTAHHIVAHSVLGDALKKLDGDRKAEVLKAAIPTTLTKEMVDNLGCQIPDTVEARAALRVALVGNDDEDTEYTFEVPGDNGPVTKTGPKLGNMRESFFEWQGGNQYQGPNTSIRAEPTAKKDDIDYDGKYFNGMSKQEFDALTDIGEALPGLKDQDTIKAKLITMLGLTKDKPVASFDAGKWQEITRPDELSSLASGVGLGRAHIEKYAYFRLKVADIGADKTWNKLEARAGSEFFYEGLKIPNFQEKGVDGYFGVDAAKGVKPSTQVKKKLPLVLQDLGVQLDMTGPNAVIPLTNKITDKGRNKFQVEGYDIEIPYLSKTNGVLHANKKMLENKDMTITQEGKSLHKYAVDGGMGVSTFLPKDLYDGLE